MIFQELVIAHGFDYTCSIYGIDKNIFNNLTLRATNDKTK
jgi:hypothetical protein